MPMSEIRAQTGFTKSEWARRLNSLYNAAKRRNGGNSLNIYFEVNQLLDYLEGYEDVPSGFDLGRECDHLAGELRRL